MIRRPPRSTLDRSSAASDVYKRQVWISPSLDNSFSVYPNPAINSLNVVASFSAHISKVEIVNIVGMSVQEVKWNTTSGKMTFDITELPQGIYFVRLLSLIHISEPTIPY